MVAHSERWEKVDNTAVDGSMSSNRSGEGEVRKSLVKANHVDMKHSMPPRSRDEHSCSMVQAA